MIFKTDSLGNETNFINNNEEFEKSERSFKRRDDSRQEKGRKKGEKKAENKPSLSFLYKNFFVSISNHSLTFSVSHFHFLCLFSDKFLNLCNFVEKNLREVEINAGLRSSNCS